MVVSIPQATDPAGEIADLLHRVNHTIRREMAAEAGPSDLSPAQMRAMRTLARSGGPLRMSELAHALGIARRSATSVVDELEALGMLDRIDDPTDRRAVRVQLTGAGRKAMADIRRRRRTAAARVLGPLDHDHMQALGSLLRRLVDP